MADKQLVTSFDPKDEASKQKAAEVYGKIQKQVLTRATAASTFRNVAPNNVSVRDGYSRQDYDYFRPEERIPTNDKDIICACMAAYKRFAIVRNTIDLMADFACKGIDLVHPSARIQDVYKEWFTRINGPERTERILNMVYRAGNAIIKRMVAKLPADTAKTFQGTAATKAVRNSKYNLKNGEIPWGYIIHDPRAIEAIDGEMSPVLGTAKFRYAISVSETLEQKIRDGATNSGIYKPISNVPTSIINVNSKSIIPLDPNNTIPIWYKKDDFEVWATPILYPLLDDLSLYNKMKMADRAALDGAINYVRLWKLGNIDAGLFPTQDGISHLADTLLNNMGGGGMDLIWGPDIDFKETNTEVHRFLGADKYAATLQAIYQGLGIPPSLSGATDGGFTNNIVSLKTLTERLEYGRMLMKMFWAEEILLVQKAFNFAEPAQLVFDSPNLSDDSAQKKLLIDMWDRALVSDEFIQEQFGALPEIELTRIQRENKQRENKKRPPKSGMFYTDSRQNNDLEKIFAQSGAFAPSSFDLEITPDKVPIKVAPAKVPGTPTSGPVKAKKGGRPLASKDIGKRKTKNVKARATAVRISAWASETLLKINETILNPYLQMIGKANARQLTNEESGQFENFKFNILCSLEPLSKASEDSIRSAIQTPIDSLEGPWELYKKALAQEDGDISLEKDRQLRTSAFSLWCIENEEGEE